MIPNPKEAAIINKFGLGKFKVTMAQPQHITTKNIMAINSATQALLNFPSIGSPNFNTTLPH